MLVHTCLVGGKSGPSGPDMSVVYGSICPKGGKDRRVRAGPHVPRALRVVQTGMIEVFSCGSTCPKAKKCIPKLIGVLWWDDIYQKGCKGRPIS